MTTLREWFAEFEDRTGERPTKVVLGWERHGSYVKSRWPEWDRWAKVTPVGDVPADLLDFEFDSGYGGNDSPNLCAWSPTWVLFSDDYDGAEGICYVPRNPTDHEPMRPGGGG